MPPTKSTASRKRPTKPAKSASKPTSASAWKRTGAGETDLDLPSGNVARVRPIRPEALIVQSGKLPNALSAIVAEAIKSKKGLPPEKVKELMSTPEGVASAIEMMDAMVVLAVVEPRVSTPPDPDDPEAPPRDPNILYVDEVDLEDKIHIFNYAVGGTRDLEQFRKELAEHVDAVSSGDDVEDTAK